MKFELSDICDYVKEKVEVSSITNKTYISTENMQPNKGGIKEAATLPATLQTQGYRANDVLVSNIRPYFRKIWFAQDEGGCSNDILVFRAKEGVNPQFLYYILSNDAFFEYATATSKGTKMPRGDKNAIMQYEVPNYELKIQNKIVEILNPIDKKIEINNKINDNLLQQAQALYKSWFVDYDPFDGIRPADWLSGTIDDLAKKVVCGKTPSTKVKEYYGSDVPFITIPDMHGNIYAVTTERYLSTYGANSQVKKMLPPNSICVSCIGTAGLVTLVASKSQTNQQINSIIPKDEYSPFYIYLLMQTLSEVINKLGQSGSTIVNLNKAQFGKIQVMLPSVADMKAFDEIVSPLFALMLKNQRENLHLSSVSEMLLPKLMSGELDVFALDL